MNKSRQIVLLGSSVLVVLVVASWFLLLSPRMSKPGDLNAQRDQLVAQNAAVESEIRELETQKANIATAKAEADELSARFPATAEEADLFRLIEGAARVAGLSPKSITDLSAGVPMVGGANGSVTLPAAPAAPAEGAAATDPNAAPAAGSPAAGSPAPASPTAPAAPAAPGSQLASMTVDLTVSGTRTQIIRFLAALEDMDRAFLVKSVTVGAGEGSRSSATVSGVMFLLPELVDPTVPADAADGAEGASPPAS